MDANNRMPTGGIWKSQAKASADRLSRTMPAGIQAATGASQAAGRVEELTG